MISLLIGLLAGCSPTRSGLERGTGYSLVTLNKPAAKAVVEMDRVAAERIASNRAQCVKDPGCQK